MHRPQFAVCLALMVLAVTSSQAEEKTSVGKRPNILFAFADDWGRFASAYAKLDGPGSPNDVVKTPNFDRIAREGALFRRAFVSSPSCTPCRSALLTGQHFWRTTTASVLRPAKWDDKLIAYPFLLRDAGYHLGETYKCWSPGTPADAPYGAGKYAYEKAGGRINQFSQQVTRMIEAGKPLEEAKQLLYDEVGANFDAFLKARPEGKPFCYWFGPTTVHRKWLQGSGKRLWNIEPDSLQGNLPPFLPDVPEVREDFADYLGQTQAFDASLGVLLARLEQTGELENTLIVVSGDHGPPGFPHGKCNLYDFGSSVSLAIRGPGVKAGRTVDDLVSLIDLAPTFLELGGVEVPKSMTGRSLAHVLQSEKSGQVDPQRTAVFIGRERHVADAREAGKPYPQRAIRTRDHLYIVNFEPDRYPLGDPFLLEGDQQPSHEELVNDTFITFADEDSGPTKAWLVEHRADEKWKPFYDRAYGKRPREELYDLRSDPQQMKNVAGSTEYAAIQKELDASLMTELRTTGDPRLIENGKFFETLPSDDTSRESRRKKK